MVRLIETGIDCVNAGPSSGMLAWATMALEPFICVTIVVSLGTAISSKEEEQC